MTQAGRSRPASTRTVSKVRRKEILDAAQACFRDRGYHLSTVDDIARRAGLSKGAIYWHFKGKREVFLALFERYTNALLERYAESLRDPHPPNADEGAAAEGLRRMADVVGPEESLEWVELSLEFMAHAGRDDDLRKVLLQMYRALRNAVQRQIEQGIRDGQFCPVNATSIATAIVATLDGLVVQKVVEPELDLSALWRDAVEVLIRGIQA
jgi:AcrR family transcriptional regulator